MSEAILITGGTGFAGSHLVEALLERGVVAENIHVTSFGGRPSYVSTLLPAKNIHQIDLTSAEKTDQLVKKLKPAQIYHLASFAWTGKSSENVRETLHNNSDLQVNILEAVKKHVPSARLLCVCSATEYAASNKPLSEDSLLGPNNPYGVSKVIQDMLAYSYVQQFGLDIVRVRPFNHIGERQQLGFVTSDFAHQIVEIEKGNQAPKMKTGNLEVWRDFSDVKDMVQAYMIVMEKGKRGEVYNIARGKSVPLKEILRIFQSLASKSFAVEMEKSRQRAGDIKKVVANINKIQQLGWSSKISLEDTLSRILEYWRNK